MSRPLRILVITALSVAAVVVVVFAIAWFMMPRDWIDREARRQVSQMKGAAVRWTRLTPAIQWLSIGVKVEGLTVRIPDVGPPKTDLRANEIFVRMKLLPLLSRRVEVSSAKLDGAWVTLTEQPPGAPAAPGSPPAPQFQVLVPRVEFHNLNVRARDTLGSGTELKGLSGRLDFQGTLDTPSSIRVSAKADSLFWKASAAAASMPLPSPLALDAALESKGDKGVLEVTHGSLELGPLHSEVAGTVTFPKREAGGGPTVNLALTGAPQKIDSGARAFQGIAAATPAKWEGTAAWEIHASGRAPDILTNGTLKLGGLSVRAKENSFLIEKVTAEWSTRADRTFTASGKGSGSGVSLSFLAKGLLTPGGATTGGLYVHAPAARLNGLVPNSPTWRTGDVELHVSFELRPPAKPVIRWSVRGTGIDGTMQGLARPVHGLQFDVEGNEVSAEIRSFRAGVGSSTLNLTGTVAQGKPLSTGTFQIAIDRLIAEEWAPPAGGKAPEKAAAPAPTSLPVPIGAFTGQVNIAEARSGNMVITKISAPVRYDGKNLVVSPIRGVIGTGSFEGSLTIASPFETPSYTVHMDVKRAPVEQVASGTMPFSSAVTGSLSGVIDLSGQGFPSAKPNDTLRGLLQGTLEDGRLKLSPTVIAIARSLGISQASDVSVSQETHTIRILGNKMVIDKASGDLGEDKAEVTGSVGLDRMLDLNVLLRLAPNRVKGSTFLSKLAQYARDPEGRLPVTLKIQGPDHAPKIQVNTQALLETATKELGKNVTRSIVENLAKGLARRPDSVRAVDSTIAADSIRNPQAAKKPPADSTAVDPRKKTRDALNKIFGK